MKCKVVLRKEESNNCVAQSHPSGKHELTIKHEVEYDFMYDDEENFYLIVEDVLYMETSTAFDFKQK